MTITQTTVFLPTILLDETNYPSWFFRLESFLKGQDLYGHVDGSVPCPPQFICDSTTGQEVLNPAYASWFTTDQSIVNMIGQTLSSAATSCAVGSKTALDLWRNLRNKFASSNRQNILQLKSNLQGLKKGGDTIEVYLDKVKVARDALATVGVFLDDEDVIVTVLHGLPSEYNAIKGVIRAQSIPPTLSDLKTLLKATEIDLECESHSASALPLTAMVAQATQLLTNAVSQSSSTANTGPSPVANSVQQFTQLSPQTQTTSPISVAPQPHYVPIPAIPYGFGQFPGFDSSFGMSGFYAGQSSNNSGGGNGYGRAGNGNNGNTYSRQGGSGGFNRSAGNNGGNVFTCQLCGKVGHGAKTCRNLSNFQSQKPKVECQYCGRDNHTADRCFEIIGFPSNQHTNNAYQRPQQPHHSQVGSAMMPSHSNGHMGSAMLASSSNTPQFWLADSGATNHMTSEVQLLQNLAPYNNGDTVQIGQGNGQGFIQRTE